MKTIKFYLPAIYFSIFLSGFSALGFQIFMNAQETDLLLEKIITNGKALIC